MEYNKTISDVSIIAEKESLYGVNSLTTLEVISFLTGIKCNSLKSYIEQFGSLINFFELANSIKELTKRQKQKINVAFELVKRSSNLDKQKKVTISSPEDVANLYMSELKYLQKEVFKVILLNVKNRIIKDCNVSIGSLNSSIVHPREVFKEAISWSASSIILMHNHPSGDCEPSCEDINTTRRLVSVGEQVGIKIIDHIIIAGNQFLSFKEDGKL